MPRNAMPFVFVVTALMSGAAPSGLLALGQQQPPPETSLVAQAATMAKAERPEVQQPTGSANNPSSSTASASAASTNGSGAGSGSAATAPEAQPTAPPTPAPVPMTVSSGGQIDLTSKYLWRGFVLADAVSVQPTYWVKFGSSLTVSSWMNVAREQLEGPLTEHDLTVDYTKSLSPKFSMSAGWINYVFPGLDSGSVTNEIYGGLSHASYLNPTVKVFVDFHEGKGTYFNFSASHTYAFGSQGFAATPSFGIGYNDKQWIDEATWSDANFGVKLTVPTPIKRLFVTPAIYYSKALNKDLGVFDDHFYGGIGIVTKLF
jgi:hypothetical protein